MAKCSRKCKLPSIGSEEWEWECKSDRWRSATFTRSGVTDQRTWPYDKGCIFLDAYEDPFQAKQLGRKLASYYVHVDGVIAFSGIAETLTDAMITAELFARKAVRMAP